MDNETLAFCMDVHELASGDKNDDEDFCFSSNAKIVPLFTFFVGLLFTSQSYLYKFLICHLQFIVY